MLSIIFINVLLTFNKIFSGFLHFFDCLNHVQSNLSIIFYLKLKKPATSHEAGSKHISSKTI